MFLLVRMFVAAVQSKYYSLSFTAVRAAFRQIKPVLRVCKLLFERQLELISTLLADKDQVIHTRKLSFLF